MYLILNFIFQNISILVYGVALSFVLTPKYPRALSLALFQTFYFFFFIMKMFVFSNAVFLVILSFASQVAAFLFTLIAFTDSVFRKILASTILIFLSLFAEYIVLRLLPEFIPALENLSADNKYIFIYSSCGISLQLIMFLPFIFLWRYFTKKDTPLPLLAFSLFPMLQIVFFLTFLSAEFFGESETRPLYVGCGILIASSANIALLYYLLRRHEKKTIQDAYLELQELYAMDLKYYEELEKQHEALSKIRHDYQNQLATLYMLISSNKINIATEFIDSLNKELNDSSE